MRLMHLAPVDYVFTGNMSCPVTFAFSFAQRLDPKPLERSLQELLACIPWLAGSLRALSEDTYAYEIDDQPTLSLSVTTSSKLFDELTDRELVPLVKSFDGERLVNARLTHTPEGSVLAVSMSHALTDGFSFFLAMNKWAALTRGESVTAPPMQRLLRAPDALVEAALEGLDERSLFEKSALFWTEPRPAIDVLPSQERIHLSSAVIADMLADAQRSVDQKLRQNDVLTAWLWRTYGTQQWAGSDTQDVYVSCPVDVRRLLGEGNQSAFGCTICGATARARYRELVQAPLGQLALRVQQSVARVFAGSYAERVAPLEAMRREHGLRALQSVQLRHPERGMLVTNMSRLPLAPLDFGCGAPSSLRLITEIPGMAAVLPARDGVTVAVYQGPNGSISRSALRAAADPAAIRRRARDRAARA